MSKRFIPPKLDMGPDFQQAGSMKAKHKSQSSGHKQGHKSQSSGHKSQSSGHKSQSSGHKSQASGHKSQASGHKSQSSTGTPGTASKRRLAKKADRDTIPLTLPNLAKYFDWRLGQFEQSPTLYKIASTIWLYLEQIPMEEYTVNFASATENEILEKGAYHAPPCLITTSPRGDLLIMVTNMKKLPEYFEKQFLIILYPYIDNIRFIEDETVQTSGGIYCTYWEIDGIEHLTHMAMDKYGIIYFTTGESVFRIVKTEGDMYLDTFEDIFTPSNDTSHITCLWRQGNEIFLTIQDWDSEENLDVYKIKPPKDKGVSTPDSPSGKAGRSPSFGRNNSGRKSSRARTRSNSGYGSDFSAGSPRGRGTANDSNDFVNKVRTFSLSFNQRIWQLGSMNFQKKFVLAIGAAQLGSTPQLLQIGFKKKIKAFGLNGQGKGNKKIVWPKSAPDELPHSIYQHKATKSWFCILPIMHQKYQDGRLFWVQFKMDKAKKKIIWQRLVPIPSEANEGDWLYYDELRDVLIGFARSSKENEEYVFKFLPDISKYFWIEGSNKSDEDDLKSNKSDNGPIMQRAIRARRKSKEKPAAPILRRSSSGKVPKVVRPTLQQTTSNEPNIKPSKAKKQSTNGSVVDNYKRKKKAEPKKKKDTKKKSDAKKKEEEKKKKEKEKGKKRSSVDVSKIKPKGKKTKKEEIAQKLEEVVQRVSPLKVQAKNDKKKKEKKSPKPPKTKPKPKPSSPKKTGSVSPRKSQKKKAVVVDQYDEEDVMD